MSDVYATQPEPPATEASPSVPKAPVGDTQTLGADDDHVRIGSAEREAAQERLREAVVHDLVTLDEYGERLEIALTAKTRGDLRAALQDLPEPQDELAGDGQLAEGSQRVARPAVERKFVVGVLGADEAKGRWRPAPTTTAVGVMGGAKLDLRSAEFEGDVLNIDAYALMGGVEIVVPDGVEVTLSGFAIMGGRDDKTSGPVDPAAPVVHVNGYALMGGVDIRNPSARERKRAERDGVTAPAGVPLRPEGYSRRGARQGRVAREQRSGRVSGFIGRLVPALLLAAALALPASWMITSDEVVGAMFGSNDESVSVQDVEAGDETTIAAPVAFGSVEIIVPEGVRVERDGLVIFGSTQCEACQTTSQDEDAPTVRVRSFGGFGSVDIVRESAR